jgi:predicted deacetylase
MPASEVLLSLHDVAPVHHARLARAEALFTELGVRRITYLLVPDFHGSGGSELDPAFRAWCHQERAFSVRWFLHGYTHRDDAPTERRAPLGARERLKRRTLTGGEGEFIPLTPAEQHRRVEAGRRCFRDLLGSEPEGFVAPAWLHNPALPEILAQHGIRYHEDHRRIYHLGEGTSRRAPVITWATRTRLRRWSSTHGAPPLARICGGAPLLRLAVHPHDFDHAGTISSIRTVWRRALAAREQRFYDEIVFA